MPKKPTKAPHEVAKDDGSSEVPRTRKRARNRSKNSPQIAKALEKAIEAYEYHVAGYTLLQIAQFCGYNSPQAVAYAIESVKRHAATDMVVAHLDLELERLERLWAAAYQSASQGDLYAIEMALKIHESKRRMLGLDKPLKVAPTDPEGTAPVPTLNWADVLAAAQQPADPAAGR